MVRGLKKKLLIGLLSAAVVGTSLAPSVPLVGSFAQEVKAEETTNTVTKSLSLTGTVTYTYTKGTLKENQIPEDGYNDANESEFYKDSSGNGQFGTTGSTQVDSAYVKYTKTGDNTAVPKYYEVNVSSEITKVTFAKPSKPADSVDGKFYSDEACSNEIFNGSNTLDKTDVLDVTTLPVYYKAKDTSKATV